MKDRHEKEESKLKKTLEIETRQAEADQEVRFKSEKEKQVFELQQRQAADRQARQDLNPAEMERVSIVVTVYRTTKLNVHATTAYGSCNSLVLFIRTKKQTRIFAILFLLYSCRIIVCKKFYSVSVPRAVTWPCTCSIGELNCIFQSDYFLYILFSL